MLRGWSSVTYLPEEGEPYSSDSGLDTFSPCTRCQRDDPEQPQPQAPCRSHHRSRPQLLFTQVTPRKR